MKHIEFAPIQGYTDVTYRNIHNQIFGGIDCYYTPFVRLENGDIRNRDVRDIHPQNNLNTPIIPQIIVNSASEFNILTEKLFSMGHRRIDINAGCPFPLQTRKGRGAALLSNHVNFIEVMSEISKISEISFSMKMRLGMTSANESKILIDIINNTPLSHITIHPRVAAQQYKGEIDHKSFSELLLQSEHPVIYNGDITKFCDIDKIIAMHPDITGIMIGRGLLSRPTFAMEYKAGKELPLHERIRLILEMHDKLYHDYASRLQGESQILLKMKTFWEYLEPEIGHKASKSIKQAGNLKNYNLAVSAII